MELKRRLLLAYLALTPLPIGALFAHFCAELRATGVASGPLATATALAAAVIVLGVLALRTVSRAGPAELGFLGARYLRIVFSLAAVAFAIVLFGARREAFARLAAHLLAVMAVHRLALLSPGRLTRALDALGRRPWLRAGEVLLFNVCATALLAEVVLRAYYAGSGQGFFGAQREHPATRKLVNDLFGEPPNRLGYNDDEFEVAKRAGTARVAAIGDSFFVAAVPRAQGVISRTEALLAETAAAPVEVYNFGVVASNIDDYEILLSEEALPFHPDLVLLGVYVGNDLRISTRSTAFHHRSYALYRAWEDVRQRLEARRLVRSGTFRDVTRASPGPRTAAVDPAAPVMPRERYLRDVRRQIELFREPSSTAVERAWYDSLAGLARIADACRARGLPFVVVISPSHPQVSRALLAEGARSAGVEPTALDVAIPQRRLVAFLASRGIPALDLLPAFQRAALERDPASLYLVNDTHWSVPGNELAARELTHFVAERLPSRKAVHARTAR